MLTANEARKIAKESDTEFKNILAKISEKVEFAAKNGAYALNLSEAFRSWDKFQCAEPRISTGKPELTDFQKKLQKELMGVGYGFTQRPITYTEGGGLGCIDPEDYVKSEIKTRYDLIISW